MAIINGRIDYAWPTPKPVNPGYILIPKFKPLLSRYERWRCMARNKGLSRNAMTRLERIIWHHEHGRNARLTSRHFSIAPKTLYMWFKRFDEKNIGSLESKSSAPKHVRVREYTQVQYERVTAIRRAHLRYGKMKILYIYHEQYLDDMELTSWKIQCIIQASGLYFNPAKQAKINKKRQRSVRRKKITELKKKKVSGFLLCFDTIVKYWNGKKRYIITAIDRYSKVAFARMYTTHSSYNSRDFLCRLYYLLDGKIKNIQTDNGSEFAGYFAQALKQLNLAHYYSRIKTPKDNAVNERFNRTLQDEFLNFGAMTTDTVLFNQKLTEWLVEYNFRRPHQTLGYVPPMNFSYKYHKVLPMYPSSTGS